MKRYVIRGRVEQPKPGEFRAVAWADPVDPDQTGAHAESVESRALSNEQALRLLVNLAAALAGAIRLRGDVVDGLDIEGDQRSSAGGAA